LLITTHELQEAERLASRVLIVHRGRVVTQGTLEELAGEEALIVETSAPIDAGQLAALLGCTLRIDAPRRYHFATNPSTENLAIVTNFLQSQGATLTSLDTRASLEETYLRLIGEQRSETP
jgi:ABC-2 type transport system ATP-binding protein